MALNIFIELFTIIWGLSRWHRGKESPCNAGDVGFNPWVGKTPGVGNGNPLQYSCLESGQRCLVGYSPWAHKESDTTE